MPKKLRIKLEEPHCKRCGRCCYILTKMDGWQPCPFLVLGTNEDSRTTCSVYNRRDRIGLNIGYGYICTVNPYYNIPGCPYNNILKPKHPYWSVKK